MSGEGFTGRLRGPADAPATVVVVPGLDSAKEEFLDLTSALLARGLAVFAMDGPEQGVLAATSTFVPDYERVVGRVVDALGVARIGLVGMSLGGYFAARAAALEPRVAAAATVSGPFRLDWEQLPPPVRDIMARRTGGTDAARAFAPPRCAVVPRQVQAASAAWSSHLTTPRRLPAWRPRARSCPLVRRVRACGCCFAAPWDSPPTS
nr:lysophospholipase [Streptomyces sp. 1114.5]